MKTTKLLIQAYLEADGTLGDLVTSYTIRAKRHGKHENLVLLKYGVDAAFMNPMVRECRGIILDESNGWSVVSRAFDKFGNHGEGYVPEIDWSTARVQDVGSPSRSSWRGWVSLIVDLFRIREVFDAGAKEGI